jgi:hypothetical protein
MRFGFLTNYSGQGSGIRGQGSEIRGQGSEIRERGTEIKESIGDSARTLTNHLDMRTLKEKDGKRHDEN